MNRYKITNERRKEGNVVETIPEFVMGRKAAQATYQKCINLGKATDWDSEDTIDDIIVTLELVDENNNVIKKITDRYLCDPYYYNM